VEYLLGEFLKFFPKNSGKGLVFGAGTGLVSYFISTNFIENTHLIAHKISGLFSLVYLGLSISIFTFNHASKKLSVPAKSFSFYYLATLLSIVFITIWYSLNLKMLKFEDEITFFFTGYIDKIFGYDNGEGYFLGFIICYSIICFLLSGFLETLYEIIYELKEKIRNN
jgi:ABC-type uncharacterized transport system permease subunit